MINTTLPDDVLVIDAVVHAFNLAPSNRASRFGEQLAGMFGGLHGAWNPVGFTMPLEHFVSDIPIDVVAETLFLETQTMVAVHHNLRLDGWFRDGLCSEAKTHRAVTEWPDRFIGYAGVDPTLGVDVSIGELERQVASTPRIIGLKLYPHQVEPFRSWRADDPDIFRLFEAAQRMGLRNIAIHKAVPNGSVPLDPYRVDDIDLAADAFPSLNFEIIHAGMAFIEETAMAMMRFPNVYANLETTTSLLFKAPGWFEEILATFMFWGGAQKILWSTGAVLSHPQPLLEAFWAFQFSEATRHKYGLKQITETDKRLILGGNYARMSELDLELLQAKTKGDAFSVRRNGGLAAPFSSWRARVGAL